MKPLINVFNYSVYNSSDDTLDINIDGHIVDSPTQEILRDWYGDETSVSYKSIRDQINKSGAKTINIYVNSGGGHVGDAMAIHDMLIDMQNKGIKVNTNVRGIAASAATYIVMASSNSSMSENSFLMVHNVSGGIWGDVNIVENYARMMRKFNDSVRDFYANKTGMRKEDVTKLMDNETWLTAAEAHAKGFVKSITGSTQFTNMIKPEHWEFQNKEVLNLYNSFTKNQDQMDIKAITTAVTDAVKNAFASFKNTKPEEQESAIENITNKVAETLTNALSPIAGLEESLKNTIAETVKNTVAELKLDESIKNQVTEATKDLVKNSDLENFKTSVSEKLGNRARETEDTSERKITNKKDFFKAEVQFED